MRPAPSARPPASAARARRSEIPRLQAGGCQLWWASASAGQRELADVLDDEERRRATALLRDADRRRFLVAHALTRIVAAAQIGCAPREIGLSRRDGDPHGKPQLTGPAAHLRFSVSHCGDHVVVAFALGVELGVDVEQIGPWTQELTGSVLTASEQRALVALAPGRRPWGLCRCWTRKEAVLKASGHGLSIEPTRIEVTAPDDAPALVRWSGPGRPALAVQLHDLTVDDGYTAALATIGGPLERTEHDANALLVGAP